MGANSSVLPVKKEERTRTPLRATSQYTNALHSNYIPDGKSTLRASSSSDSISDESDDALSKTRKDAKAVIERQKEDMRTKEALRMLDGLSCEDRTRKSEEAVRQLWKALPTNWSTILEVTKIQAEVTPVDGQVGEDVQREVKHDVDKIIYDVPLENCHLKISNARTLRSCPDPWRRHGAHVKLCEIGGTIPENKAKNSRMVMIPRGSTPPPAPRTKPLLTIDDYLRIVRK